MQMFDWLVANKSDLPGRNNNSDIDFIERSRNIILCVENNSSSLRSKPGFISFNSIEHFDKGSQLAGGKQFDTSKHGTVLFATI